MEKKDVIIPIFIFLILLPLISSYEFCEETTSEDELEIMEITFPAQSSQTNWTWKPSETINIEVRVMNKNFTARNFKVELFFLDDDLEAANITTTSGNPTKTVAIQEDETETLEFTFTLQEPKEDTYYLYARATDANNDTICTSLRATSGHELTTVTILPEEKIITVRNISGPSNIKAGSSAEYTVEVINLGNKKEERVLVIIYSEKLKIRQEKEIVSLAIEEAKTVKFNFTVPENTSTTQETLLFSTEYDYDSSNGLYYRSMEKAKPFSIQIQTTQSPNTQEINQTQSQATQAPGNTSATQENSIGENSEPESKIDFSSFLMPGFIILGILAIAALAILFFKSKKNKDLDESMSGPTAASEYVKNIQKNKSKNPSPQDKPSEKNTENTKSPPTSQNPPQEPGSLEYPEVTSSSLKSTAAKSASPPPTKQNQPQKSQPSPQNQSPNKTSSP